MKRLIPLALTVVAILAGCASSTPKKPKTPENQPPPTEAEMEAQKKAKAMAVWTSIRKQMGKDWFEKTESVVWKNQTVFGAGVARFATGSQDPATSGTLEVKGPYFLASGTYILWNATKSGVLRLEGSDRIDASGAQYLQNPFGTGDPYSDAYPWRPLLKAPAKSSTPSPAKTGQ
jgi:hypothetical protein